jgi:phosphopantetheinyl transferase
MEAALRLGLHEGGTQGRRAALLGFCAESLSLAPQRLSLAHDAFGAPRLRIDGAPGDWRVSSASRERLALFGLSRQRIGVDVEIATVLEPAIEPAWNILHDSEKAALAALPEAGRAQEFLRLWTAKEAYVKALGLGLRREPSEIAIAPQGDSFRLFDRNRAVALAGARLWRESVGGREAVCACVTLPD